jgi:hypothetical protein
MRIAVVLVSLCLGVTRAAWPQRGFDLPTANGRYTAITLCLAGQPTTFVDARILGTDSLAEVLAHEARHREQYLSRRCEEPDSTRASSQLLADEIEAYCASLPYALRRGVPRGERVGVYVRRMYQQTGGSVPIREIVQRFSEACPEGQ